MEKIAGLEYEIYLSSEKWRIITEQVKDRDGRKCAMCGSTEELQVHHKTYEHIFHEEDHLDDLITLCKKCHFGYHEWEKKEKEKKHAERLRAYEMREEKKKEYIAAFVEKYKHLDFAFGGKENLCKFETIEMYWLQLYGEECDIRYYTSDIRNIFRQFKIDAIHKLKAEGLTQREAVKTGIPRKWIDKYWNTGEEVIK